MGSGQAKQVTERFRDTGTIETKLEGTEAITIKSDEIKMRKAFPPYWYSRNIIRNKLAWEVKDR